MKPLNNNVTDLETSKKLVPYMKGVETEKYYDENGDLLIKKQLPTQYYNITKKYSQVIWDDSDRHRTLVPAYSLDDIRKMFGSLMTVPARYRTGNEVVYFTVMNGGRNGKGKVGLMSFEGHVYNWYKVIHVEKTPVKTAAKLLLWLGEQGLLEGKV